MKRIVVLVLVSVVWLGCEPSHPSQDTVEKFLAAAQYNDKDGARSLHTLGTPTNVFCANPAFDRLLARVRDTPEATCARLGEIEIDSLSSEARLLTQIQRAVCEDPSLDCNRYARRVFESQWDALPEIKKTRVTRVIGDDTRAAAYVDLHSENAVRHHTLKLVQIDGEWFVSEGFFSAD